MTGFWSAGGQGADGGAEAVELFQGGGKLVQLIQNCTCLWKNQTA